MELEAEVAACSRRRLGIAAGAALCVVLGCAVSPARQLGLPPTASGAEIAEAERLSLRALDRWIEHDSRLQRVSQRMRVAGRELCGGDVAPVLGLAVSGHGAVPESYRAAARVRFAGAGLYVVAVFPGMAAAAAGVEAGDVLLEIASSSVRAERDVYRPRAMLDPAIALRVLRDGTELLLTAESTQGCAYPARLTIAEVVNAAARPSARETYFNTALLREVHDDDQLALVVGHEIAHIILGRVLRTWSSRRDTEAEADYIGAYLAARAGHDLDVGDIEVFDTLVFGNVDAVGRRSRTHPITSARTLALRETLDEIERKRRAGEPLEPSERSPLLR
jgi:hypothetical protein